MNDDPTKDAPADADITSQRPGFVATNRVPGTTRGPVAFNRQATRLRKRGRWLCTRASGNPVRAPQQGPIETPHRMFPGKVATVANELNRDPLFEIASVD